MAKDSHIEWTHHTFNPWLGCVEVSPACDHCYARTLVTGRMGKHVWGKDKPRPETSENYWHQPFAWDRAAERAGERHRVFCGSLCDVMEDRRDLDRIRGDLYKLIESTPHLDWLLLTKRPQNFRKFLPLAWLKYPLPNVWGMTTVESAEYLWRVVELLNTPFAIRGLSCEPLLGPLDLSRVPLLENPAITRNLLTGEFFDVAFDGRAGGKIVMTIQTKPRIDWVIVGGESGAQSLPIRPTHPAWVRGIRNQCAAAGVAFFFKQWGEFQHGSAEFGGPRDYVVLNNGQQCKESDLDRFQSENPEVRRRWQEFQPEAMGRVGKNRAGRLLDGREWNEFPAAMCAPAHNRSGGPDPHDPQWFEDSRP